MSRIFIILLICCFPALVSGQLLSENTLLLNDENYSKIGIQFNGEANSSAISNSVLNSFFISGDGATKDEIKTIIPGLDEVNYAGANLWIKAFYQQKLRRQPIDYYRVSIEYTDFISARFSDDLLGVTMLGNAAYENEKAEFNQTNYTNYNSQKVGFYIGKKLNKKSKIDAGLSILKGGRYQSLKTNNSSLYTAPYGEYLDIEMDLDYRRTKPNKLWLNMMGYGFSTDFHWSYNLSDSSVSILNVGVNDLGMMNWFDVETYTLDTSFRFEGLVIDNVFDTINLSTSTISPDSIGSVFGVKQSKGNKWIFTPFTIFANYQKGIGKKIKLSFGAQYTFGVSLLPLITTTIGYKLNEGFSLYPMLSYGGFGSYNIGLGVDKKIGEKINLRVQSRFLDGLAMYSSKGGQGIYFSVIYKL